MAGCQESPSPCGQDLLVAGTFFSQNAASLHVAQPLFAGWTPTRVKPAVWVGLALCLFELLCSQAGKLGPLSKSWQTHQAMALVYWSCRGYNMLPACLLGYCRALLLL